MQIRNTVTHPCTCKRRHSVPLACPANTLQPSGRIPSACVAGSVPGTHPTLCCPGGSARNTQRLGSCTLSHHCAWVPLHEQRLLTFQFSLHLFHTAFFRPFALLAFSSYACTSRPQILPGRRLNHPGCLPYEPPAARTVTSAGLLAPSWPRRLRLPSRSCPRPSPRGTVQTPNPHLGEHCLQALI